MSDARLPVITLTTDFGDSDHYVGSVKGAILAVSTQVAIVDITHQVPAHDVMEGGWILRNAFGSFPRFTVHVAVVDPGVGTARKPIVAVTGNHFFIGPDNGIFSFVFEAEPPTRVFEITSAHYLRTTVSATFHARDIFAPVAANLARGIDPSNFGPPLDNFTRLDLPRARVTPEGIIRAPVVHIDRFGNVILNVTRSALEAFQARTNSKTFAASVGSTRIDTIVSAYAEAPKGAAVLLFNSSGYLEIAANRARASEVVKARIGDIVDLVLQPA